MQNDIKQRDITPSWAEDYTSVIKRMVGKLMFGDALISATGKFVIFCKPDENNTKRYYIYIDNVLRSRRKRIDSVVSNLIDYGCDETIRYEQQGAIAWARRQFGNNLENVEYLDFLPILDFTTKDSSVRFVRVSALQLSLKPRRIIDAMQNVCKQFTFYVQERHTRWLNLSVITLQSAPTISQLKNKIATL